jgi:tight adherence protein B
MKREIKAPFVYYNFVVKKIEKKVGEEMGFNLLLFVLLMTATILIANMSRKNDSMLESRKQQSSNILRENVLKKRLEHYTEAKVKFSKRYAIETLCLQAGYKMTYVEFLMISIGTAIVSAFLVGMIMNNPALAIMFALIGYMLPKQAIVFMKNRRVTLMEKQMGPFMQMVIKRYETTKDFGKSLELTLVEFKGEEPMYSEIKQTVLEVNVGVPVGEAMDNMGRRTGNKYMVRLADYYKIASTLGTEEIRKKLLNQAYSQFEENRRAKASMKKELSGPVREAYIMLASIPMFAIYQIMTNDTYIDFMINTSMGKIGTAVIASVFMGCIWFVNAKIGAPLE